MARLSVLQRFEYLKTKSKLLATFGVISVIIMTMSAIGVSTLRQLATSSQTVYVDYTVPLAEFAEMGTALTTHHQILTGIAGVTRQADLIADVTRLSPYQAKRTRKLRGRAWRDASGGRVDPSMPYEVRLASGKRIAVFFYDGPISQAIAFDERPRKTGPHGRPAADLRGDGRSPELTSRGHERGCQGLE